MNRRRVGGSPHTGTVEVLVAAHVDLDPGLTESELREAEDRFGFRFAVDHRALLAAALPRGPGFPDWRALDGEALTDHLRLHIDRVLFDVEQNAFWPPSWGNRPEVLDERTARAEEELAAWPQLIPIYSHRYMPAGAPTGAPVFSAYQTDVIYYGADLLGYLDHEFFNGGPVVPDDPESLIYAPWSRLAMGYDVD